MNIANLISIAEDLNLQDKVRMLRFFADRLTSPDKDLILPLVGEFSSGKTTLINSLLDNPNLETASRATTASIFEIHFGATECRADIVSDDGMVDSVKDVADIKNDSLNKVEVVKVYDTSHRIGSSTILVDTPGLSSNNPAHRIALSSYLPNADAILLLTDVNQQFTRSLIDFLNALKLANKPVYAVITKCDTKTPSEVAAAKAYIERTIEFPFKKIIAISATKGNMTEFDELIAEIQKNKNAIVERSINERVKEIAKDMAITVSELIKQGDSTKDLDKAIEEEQQKLDRINRNIDSLINEVDSRVEEKSDRAISQFSKNVFSQVDNIVKTQGRDCDQAVYSAVNSTGMMVIQNFQRDVLADILSLARSRQSRMEEVPMGVLETVNLANDAFNGFSYDIDLSSVGHEHDKRIGMGILGVAAVGALVATAGTAAAAGGAATVGGATVGGGAATAGTIATRSGATIATDIATDAILYHKISKVGKMASMVNKGSMLLEEASANISKIDQKSQELGEKAGMKRGLINTTVGWVTEFFAKPARQRAVSNYIDGTLIPEFRQQVLNVSSSLTREVSSLLRQEATNSCENIRATLQSLKTDLNEKKEDYSRKMNQYKQYANILNEI